MKENQMMSTCNRLDLPTLGSQPVIMPRNLPNHHCEHVPYVFCVTFAIDFSICAKNKKENKTKEKYPM